MQLIGLLRWEIELGCIDIHTEVAILSQYNALPRKGHLDALHGIFAYMRKKLKSWIDFEPDELDINGDAFNAMEVWDDFYADAEELLPPKNPKARGKNVSMHFFVDYDHVGNKVTQRSHT